MRRAVERQVSLQELCCIYQMNNVKWKLHTIKLICFISPKKETDVILLFCYTEGLWVGWSRVKYCKTNIEWLVMKFHEVSL